MAEARTAVDVEADLRAERAELTASVNALSSLAKRDAQRAAKIAAGALVVGAAIVLLWRALTD
jgi:TRAP-type C4-dicarboxylate transport system permease small subunit